MKVIIVDEKDNEIGVKPFTEIDYETEIYRVSAVWIQNAKNELLLAQRAFTKLHSPGAWGPSAAGTLEVGETYDENIIKEVQEELGVSLDLKDLVKGKKLLTVSKNPDRKYFTQWYSAIVDKPIEKFTIQKEEVEAIRWISKEDLLAELTVDPEKFLDTFFEGIVGLDIES